MTALFVGVWVPETNGKSFKEIQECLGAKVDNSDSKHNSEPLK